MELRGFNNALDTLELGNVKKLVALLESVDAERDLGVSAARLMHALEQFEERSPLPIAIHDAVIRRIGDPAEDINREADTVLVHQGSGNSPVGALIPPAPGYIVADRYRLEDLIGEGGMSRTYRATDLRALPGSDDVQVALKLFLRPLADPLVAYPAIVADFKRLQALNHFNIVRLFDCGVDKKILFIAMEYVSGETLYARMRGEPAALPARSQMLSILDKLADALEYAHQHSIVHGDLKPGNILISDENVKIIDFSIAGLTAPLIPVALTPRYASPQLLSRQRTEPTDDVYSLACIAYEMLTARHPEGGTGAVPPITFPPARDEQLSASQYAAIVHGLEPERARRTPSVAQFQREWTATRSTSDSRPRVIWTVLLLAALAVSLYAMRTWHHGVVSPQLSVNSSEPLPASLAETRFRDCEACPVMKVLPAGSMLQGAKPDDAAALAFEKPQHRVSIATPFAMSETAVTVEQFARFVMATNRNMTGCEIYDGKWHVDAQANWQQPGFNQTPRHPVVCASWNDAVAYADWLSRSSGHRYRLPSSGEWEYAARAGADAATPWGSDSNRACSSANVADASAAAMHPAWTVFSCNDGFVNTAPVASFSANAFGLFDMLGNVFAWNQDCWHENYVGAPSDGSARLDATCSERELRGGSWFSAPSYIRTSYRNHFDSDYRGSSVGIRLVRELTP